MDTKVTLRKVSSSRWELVHPPCASERLMDIDEVLIMLSEGERHVATDELRWLLDGCSDFIQAHRLLGMLAVETGDIALARGHFGHAFRIGSTAIRKAGGQKLLPYDLEANRDYFEAGKGLIECLIQLDKHTMAHEIVTQLVACDPTDPLEVQALIAPSSTD